MHMGRVLSVDEYQQGFEGLWKNSSLLELALGWLRADLQDRGQRQDKIKWEDIEPEVLDHGGLEKHKEGGFETYFAGLRGHVLN
jgi:hypothetical protein